MNPLGYYLGATESDADAEESEESDEDEELGAEEEVANGKPE